MTDFRSLSAMVSSWAEQFLSAVVVLGSRCHWLKKDNVVGEGGESGDWVWSDLMWERMKRRAQIDKM